MSTEDLPDYQIPISIQAITLTTLPIDIAAQTISNLTVDITAQTVGNIDVNIAAQDADITIDIAAQSVDLDIKTSGGANIVIDKLTQTAYTERRSTISNNGTAAFDSAPTGNTRAGKFYPRGMRGFLDDIEVYCHDDAAAGGTITVYISPYIGAGYTYTADVTVPAGGAADWRAASFHKMWNYDSMFIWVVCSNSDTRVSYDTGTEWDSWTSTDAGVTWTRDNTRYHIRAVMQGETIGDIPVSGTINVIQVPSESATRQDATLTAAVATAEYDTLQYGSGNLLIAIFYVKTADDMKALRPRILCDGNQVLPFDRDFEWWEAYLVSTGSPGISIGAWDATNERYSLVVAMQYPFKRTLQLGYYNEGAAERVGYVGYSYQKIS